MPDPMLEALWKKVVDDWDDNGSHARFLQHCQATEQLAQAAARYAGMKGDAQRGASAQKRLDAVAVLATSSLLAARIDRVPAFPRWFTAVVLFAFTAVGGYVLLCALR